MEGYSRKDEGCHQFLDLVMKERELHARISDEKLHGFSEEKKLELRLAPPGEDWTTNNNNNKNSKNSSGFGHFSDNPCAQNPVFKSPWQQQQASSHFLHLQSQPCSNRAAPDLKNPEKKTFSPANLAVPNNSAQKRTAPAPVVGWPPIRSFRKNLASGGSSKLSSELGDVVENKSANSKPKENCAKTMFVKINMDGIPIGRKVDLKAYDSYEKLSFAVDELFRGLLAAQGDGGVESDGGKVIGGLLDGNREYTFVYEDNEGDRMLVGDVPWHMFVSTVKRLRVLKSSELPTLSRGGKQRKHMALDASQK
ncbi:auxin-responsive protein IAA18-like [Salvia miltiorrhiza]|uniref:auxin-responsive protein IAA18-like n=1 Tax=Salvia miltiorrhiza TaxID=226208 RepID=UPI0025AC0FCD|nr:auxin-responsive protein IAA18-like [Salvia miltiorrhiza]XP_057797219.1 auxin-responsive protein IAA18-like [Salvia miltiorrhiza]